MARATGGMTAATTSDRRYNALIERIVDQCQAIENQNLQRYYLIGQHFSEFVQGLADGKKYGEATVEKLATDLKDRGVLEDIRDPTRFLYWAKNLHDEFPDRAKLETLAGMGFTVSHAKVLFAVKSPLRQEVEAVMIEDGRMISTRALQDLVNAKTQQRIADASKEAAEANRASRESGDPPPDAPTGAAIAGGQQAEEADDEDELEAESQEEGEESGEQAAAPEAAQAAERPANVPATGAPPRERSISAPLKVLSDMEKALTSANSKVPDAFIVLRESAQIGFDSDRAADNYRQRLAGLKSVGQSIIEPLQELLAAIQQELDAAEVPPLE